MLRDFKTSIKVVDLSINNNGVDCEALGSYEFDMSDTLDIEVKNITPEVKRKRREFNRAKEKRELMRLIDEELEIGE